MTCIIPIDHIIPAVDASPMDTLCSPDSKANDKAPADNKSTRNTSPDTIGTHKKIFNKFIHLLNSSSRIVVILGAGVSVSAGIPVPLQYPNIIYSLPLAVLTL